MDSLESNELIFVVITDSNIAVVLLTTWKKAHFPSNCCCLENIGNAAKYL